jgi:8-oxo-dGTP diphosphatase
MDHDGVLEEWMMFTFLATQGEGNLIHETEEGQVEWKKISDIPHLPMAEGDRLLITKILTPSSQKVITGQFTYSKEWEFHSAHFDE